MSIHDQRDPRFRALIHPNAQLQRIGSGFEWAEGRHGSPPPRC